MSQQKISPKQPTVPVPGGDTGGAAQPKEGSSSNAQNAPAHLNPSAPEDANTTPGTTGTK